MNTNVSPPELKPYAYLSVIDGVVYDVSYPWMDMTGFTREQVVTKNIQDIFSVLLNANFSITDIENGKGKKYFIFTNSFNVRQINIFIRQGLKLNEKIYIFTEQHNSRIEYKFPVLEQLCVDDVFGIAVFSISGLILLKANSKYLDFLDEPYNKIENCLGKRINDIVRQWDCSAVKEIWKNVLETGKTCQIKELMLEKTNSGETYWNFVLIPIFENEKLEYIAAIVEDVTASVLNRKRNEEQSKINAEERKSIEKMLDMKDEFFSVVSHEFRTPLTVINAAIQTMEFVCKDELSKKASGYVGKIRQNTLKLLRLVNNLLDITKVDSGFINVYKKNIDIVSLTKSITDSVVVYAQFNGVDLTFTSKLSHKVIGIDDEKFERILLNLLSNAIKFTPKGKSVEVCVSSGKSEVCISVSDEGIGIPEEKKDVIFERFMQANAGMVRETEGTGIGLALVKSLTTALEGKVELESTVGKGSRFIIKLPAGKVSEDLNEGMNNIGLEDRLINRVAVEFSDIYLSG